MIKVNPQPDLNPALQGLTLMLSLGALVLVLAVLAITLLGFRRYYRDRWTFQGNWEITPPQRQSEPVVMKMKVGSSDNTVSVYENDGKSHILIEGDVSDREKKRLIRYLKAEGFI